MKYEGKRISVILLVLSMIIGLLAGCSSQGGSEESVTSQEKVESGEQASGSIEEESEEPVVITMVNYGDPAMGDFNDMWFTKTVEEKFNVDLQVEAIPADVYDEKIPLRFASGDLPDVFISGLSDELISQYGSEGYLIDLNEYINEENTPNLYAKMEEYPALKSLSMETDGKIYGVRGMDMGEANMVTYRTYINYDWAEQILGKVPETLDEFYEYLKGVKEQDMNGNGDPTDEIPFGGIYEAYDDDIHFFLPILQGFGYTSLEFEAIDGEVVYVPAEDNYKYFLEYMNMLYEEKLLDNECFTQTYEQFNAKDTNYLYGAYPYWASWVNQPDETIWRQYDILEPLTSEYNSVKKGSCRDAYAFGKIMITNKCENPEKVMEIVDWLFTEEGTMSVVFGFEQGTVEGQEEYGYTYEWLDEKTFSVEEHYDESKYANLNEWKWFEVVPGNNHFPSFRTFNMKYNGPQGYLEDGMVEHVSPYAHVGWPDTVKFTLEETEELALLEVDIESYVDEMVPKMINGELSIDEFESFREGLKARNIDRMLEIYQTAYDRWEALQ